MGPGTKFEPLIVDTFGTEVETLIFCSGFIYFKLMNMLGTTKPKVAIARVEELAPFPMKNTQDLLQKYPKSK